MHSQLLSQVLMDMNTGITPNRCKLKADCKEMVLCPICTDYFDEPRDLVCEHTFCIECLQEYQKKNKPREFAACPVCKQHTVPPLNRMNDLIKNHFAVKLVTLVKDDSVEPQNSNPSTVELTPKKWDRPADAKMKKPKPEFKDGNGDMEGAIERLFDGEGIPGVSMADQLQIMAALAGEHLELPDVFGEGNGTTDKSGETESELPGAPHLNGLTSAHPLNPLVETSANGPSAVSANPSEVELIIEQRESEAGRAPKAVSLIPDTSVKAGEQSSNAECGRLEFGAEGVIHPDVKCDHCQIKAINGARFKCGICEEYNLCKKCFLLAPTTPTHLEWHLCVLITKPVHVKPGPLLKFLEVRRHGITTKKNQTFHSTVICDGCQINTEQSGVRGLCFRCGLCDDFYLCQSCIANSREKHEPNHTFVVYRYHTDYSMRTNLQTYNLYEAS